ncbi:MAG TPA: hypothetical protein VFS09_02300 [Candidatus Eisenbacteria bacterium]|nr:hypothetical protein [Candidatus Eisenbacteria bacterium]
MPRTLGYPVRRIALAVALAILGGALVAHALHRPRQDSGSATAPAAARAAGASTVATASMPLESEAPAKSVPASAQSDAPAIAAATPATPRGSAGMIVGIDPETGKLGLPSKAERAALDRAANLSPALDRSDAGLTVIHRPDGSMMVDLQGRFQDYAVMRITPDGRKVETCVQESELDAALRGDDAPGATATAEPAARTEPRHEER